MATKREFPKWYSLKSKQRLKVFRLASKMYPGDRRKTLKYLVDGTHSAVIENNLLIGIATKL